MPKKDAPLLAIAEIDTDKMKTECEHADGAIVTLCKSMSDCVSRCLPDSTYVKMLELMVTFNKAEFDIVFAKRLCASAMRGTELAFRAISVDEMRLLDIPDDEYRVAISVTNGKQSAVVHKSYNNGAEYVHFREDHTVINRGEFEVDKDSEEAITKYVTECTRQMKKRRICA